MMIMMMMMMMIIIIIIIIIIVIIIIITTDRYSKLTRSSYRYCLPHCSFFGKNAF